MIYLYVKTHNKTGLNYLGKTTAANPHTYWGSGKHWCSHVKKHGYDVTTTILLATESEEELKETGLFFSKMFNIVASPEWANLIEESGAGGWSHVHNKETQMLARARADKTLLEKYGVDYAGQLPQSREANSKRMIAANKIRIIFDETRRKISVAASMRTVSKDTKSKTRDSLSIYYRNKGIFYILVDGPVEERIDNLKMWCTSNGFEYQKVFQYLDRGPVKYIPRHDSPTRRWFIGKELRRGD